MWTPRLSCLFLPLLFTLSFFVCLKWPVSCIPAGILCVSLGTNSFQRALCSGFPLIASWPPKIVAVESVNSFGNLLQHDFVVLFVDM